MLLLDRKVLLGMFLMAPIMLILLPSRSAPSTTRYEGTTNVQALIRTLEVESLSELVRDNNINNNNNNDDDSTYDDDTNNENNYQRPERPAPTPPHALHHYNHTAVAGAEQRSLDHLRQIGVRIKPPGEWEVGVCSGTKSSGAWLQEWIELQLLFGIDHLWLVNDNDDDTEDGTQAIMEFYQALGFVTIIPGKMPRKHRGCKPTVQDRTYAEYNCAPPKYCAEQVGTQVRWLLFADTDEFIFPRQGCSVSNFVQKSCNPRLTNVQVRWERFGANGHEMHPSGLMMENFMQSGGDCGGLRHKVFKELQKTCSRTPFTHCSECRNTKVLWNMRDCCTTDHVGWIHSVVNTTSWKKRLGHVWPSSPDPNGVPWKSDKCIHVEQDDDSALCNAWAKTVPAEPAPIEFSSDCCAAGIGYNHYGTKSLQYYRRKQYRSTDDDPRGWRISLPLIDLSGTISFTGLRFVRLLKDRFKRMGIVTAINKDFIDLPEGTCFQEHGYKYEPLGMHGTKSVEHKEIHDAKGCCRLCLKEEGCQGWSLNVESRLRKQRWCTLIFPTQRVIRFGEDMGMNRFPRETIPADRYVSPKYISGLVVKDECYPGRPAWEAAWPAQ